MILLADPWLHNLDPFAIDFSGTFVGDMLIDGIRWYGLSYLAGFLLGFLLIRRVLSTGVSPLKPAQAADLVVTIAIGIVIGGRLGYVAFYQRDLFTEFTADSFPFWGVLKVNQGGMASHGGILGGIAGCLFFAWRQKLFTRQYIMHLFDLMAFGGPLGLFMGRIANFINGELFGRACPRDFAFAVQFPQEIDVTWDGKALKALSDFAQAQGERGDFNKYELTQLATEQVQAGNKAWIDYLSTAVTPRYPSQLFAGITEGLVVFTVLFILYRKPVKAGLIGGGFCITYALMRVFNELFRRPDPQFIEQGQLPTITQGQWLSFGLLMLGIATIVVARRSKQDKLGGWLSGKGLATL